ncbi:ankyrin repeat and SOCS box protein 13 isoform X1 [Octopus sinensis]|uniref:Ankyrin repeat and SOCS box protein 13 isoform X1 n=1 Tax=Octopus sinensis TaxID=2607531 RepID=A0A6P7TLP4_9MOLL|nr:ankyrin repeat and SOCS box protein 13 isoform X1 [Octopus sinensis]
MAESKLKCERSDKSVHNKQTSDVKFTMPVQERAIEPNVLKEYLDTVYPLQKAARDGRADILKLLVKKYGMNVNCQTYDLVTPLHEASAWGHMSCVTELIQLDASVNARNIDGSTPLCEASSHGKTECVRLLLAAGAYVNPPLLLTTPLHEAVFNNNWECTEILTEAGANLEASDIHFGTPLLVTCLNGYIKCAKVLLQSGANVNAARTHQTPLHEAIKQGLDNEFLTLLLEHGANTRSLNNQGLLPRHLARQNSSVIKLLDYWEKNPQSLLFYARKSILKAIRTYRLIPKLEIPQILQNYLSFK